MNKPLEEHFGEKAGFNGNASYTFLLPLSFFLSWENLAVDGKEASCVCVCVHGGLPAASSIAFNDDHRLATAGRLPTQRRRTVRSLLQNSVGGGGGRRRNVSILRRRDAVFAPSVRPRADRGLPLINSTRRSRKFHTYLLFRVHQPLVTHRHSKSVSFRTPNTAPLPAAAFGSFRQTCFLLYSHCSKCSKATRRYVSRPLRVRHFQKSFPSFLPTALHARRSVRD